ncbi:unnamed protein product [Rotaria sp. Silwood1]|nr:unnamed protein product [Rotaria sp. Silwood1]CAF3642231.1 unnamed protein product [Rotaria sp. Silwood1]
MHENNTHSFTTLNIKHDNNHSLINNLNDTSKCAEIDEFVREVDYWVTIIQCCMVLFGVLGNGLALIVINRRSLRNTSSSVFITYLAIFDSLVLIAYFTYSVIWDQYLVFLSSCVIIYLHDFFTLTSVWIMVIITIERYIAVHSPFLAKRFCTIEHARYSMYTLIFLTFIFSSLSFPLVYTINKNKIACDLREQFRALFRFVQPAMFYFIPGLILLVNFFTIYELLIAKRQRTQILINPENATNSINAISFNKQQTVLTIMLVTDSLSFYLFTIPACINYMLWKNLSYDIDTKEYEMRYLISNLTNIWRQMNSATNFLFYYIAGSKFRAACLETWTDISDYIQTKFDCNGQRSRSLRNPPTNQRCAQHRMLMSCQLRTTDLTNPSR